MIVNSIKWIALVGFSTVSMWVCEAWWQRQINPKTESLIFWSLSSNDHPTVSNVYIEFYIIRLFANESEREEKRWKKVKLKLEFLFLFYLLRFFSVDKYILNKFQNFVVALIEMECKGECKILSYFWWATTLKTSSLGSTLMLLLLSPFAVVFVVVVFVVSSHLLQSVIVLCEQAENVYDGKKGRLLDCGEAIIRNIVYHKANNTCRAHIYTKHVRMQSAPSLQERIHSFFVYLSLSLFLLLSIPYCFLSLSFGVCDTKLGLKSKQSTSISGKVYTKHIVWHFHSHISFSQHWVVVCLWPTLSSLFCCCC